MAVEDRVGVCDLGAFGKWREWPGAEDVEISIQSFTADEAQGRAAEGGDEDARTVRPLQLSVLLRVSSASDMAVERADAIRWISIPTREGV